MSDVQAQLYDLTVPEFEQARVDFLVKEARATMERYFDIVELTDSESGVVYKNGKLVGVLAPGKRQLYWKGSIEVKPQRRSRKFRPAWPSCLLAQSSRYWRRHRMFSARLKWPTRRLALLIVDGKFV